MEMKSIWLCDRCNRCIRSRKTPKFCRARGIRRSAVPEELTVLVGLGIRFTTCVNLYRDDQEFTRGNAMYYWNEPGETVRELPRPLKACGFVFLASKSDKATNYFRVRPDRVHRAISWLISNTLLFNEVTISEQILQALEEIDVDRNIPSFSITDEEVQELQGQNQQVHRSEEPALSSTGNYATNNDFIVSQLEGGGVGGTHEGELSPTCTTAADEDHTTYRDASPVLTEGHPDARCSRSQDPNAALKPHHLPGVLFEHETSYSARCHDLMFSEDSCCRSQPGVYTDRSTNEIYMNNTCTNISSQQCSPRANDTYTVVLPRMTAVSGYMNRQ